MIYKLRIQLIRRDLKLKDLAGLTGIDYDRLQKVLHAYRTPRPEEVEAMRRRMPDRLVTTNVGSRFTFGV